MSSLRFNAPGYGYDGMDFRQRKFKRQLKFHWFVPVGKIDTKKTISCYLNRNWSRSVTLYGVPMITTTGLYVYGKVSSNNNGINNWVPFSNIVYLGHAKLITSEVLINVITYTCPNLQWRLSWTTTKIRARKPGLFICPIISRPYLPPCFSDNYIGNNYLLDLIMMTSSNGSIFRVTGHLCGEFTGPRWIPRTNASDAEL